MNSAPTQPWSKCWHGLHCTLWCKSWARPPSLCCWFWLSALWASVPASPTGRCYPLKTIMLVGLQVCRLSLPVSSSRGWLSKWWSGPGSNSVAIWQHTSKLPQAVKTQTSRHSRSLFSYLNLMYGTGKNVNEKDMNWYGITNNRHNRLILLAMAYNYFSTFHTAPVPTISISPPLRARAV